MSKIQDIVWRALKHWFPEFKIFVDYRPDWLHGLEVDFFIPEMNLAIEVQGVQHYKFVPHFHGDIDGFGAQKRRDELKRKILKSRGINFLTARQRRNRSLGGLTKKLSTKLHHTFRLPSHLSREWDEHLKMLNTNKSYVSYKVKKRKDLKPSNPEAEKWLHQKRTSGKTSEALVAGSTSPVNEQAHRPRTVVSGLCAAQNQGNEPPCQLASERTSGVRNPNAAGKAGDCSPVLWDRLTTPQRHTSRPIHQAYSPCQDSMRPAAPASKDVRVHKSL